MTFEQASEKLKNWFRIRILLFYPNICYKIAVLSKTQGISQQSDFAVVIDVNKDD